MKQYPFVSSIIMLNSIWYNIAERSRKLTGMKKYISSGWSCSESSLFRSCSFMYAMESYLGKRGGHLDERLSERFFKVVWAMLAVSEILGNVSYDYSRTNWHRAVGGQNNGVPRLWSISSAGFVQFSRKAAAFLWTHSTDSELLPKSLED